MEKLHYEFDGRRRVPNPQDHVLVGVVASGNLEVMMEPAELDGRMRVEVTTAARGFGDIWRVVLRDFSERHPLADVRVSINDVGATPAVVSLRLDQAAEAFEGDGP
ncbi:MAG: malonate decarboxylase acyl carrier protein [Pseudomonadota bacterium]|nr:malonate decarboxylase acyl carrier protein [Pseudomonadota bacterium]